MTSVEVVIAIMVALFGGGGLTAFFRLGGEKTKIIVEAAQGAVVVQSAVLDDVLERLDRAEKRAGAAEVRADDAERALRAMRIERNNLADRVQHLEQVVRDAGLDA